MTIEQAKTIDLKIFLAELGYKPTRRGSNTYTYSSPIRKESSPSFVVYINTNRWWDYGIGAGGDILDFVRKKYVHLDSTSKALEWLANNRRLTCKVQQPAAVPLATPENTSSSLQLRPLQHRSLLQYMSTRGISNEVATRYCKEVWYNHGEKRYYGVAFPTCSKGIEVRNKYIKRCIGHKDVSYIRVNRDVASQECCVFEGFMDFLSYMMFYQKRHSLAMGYPCDCLVLNSVSNIKKALPMLECYFTIHGYLDNDDAGCSAMLTICERYPQQTVDESYRYKKFNDVNDYLMSCAGLIKE